MTQDEVDLIYSYLHENYRYEDGELVLKENKFGRVSGDALGCFQFNNKQYATIVSGIKLNGKQKHIPVKKLIWIFHHNEWPKYLYHLDENPLNNKIENLARSKRRKLLNLSNDCIWFDGKKYTLQMKENKKSYYFGRFDSKMDALDLYNKIYKLNMIENICLEELKRQYASMQTTKLPCGVNRLSASRFGATIRVNKIRNYLGCFKTPEEAHAAYLKAKEEYAQRA